MMKPGYKTTEFWLTVVSNAAIVLTASADLLPPKWAALALALANTAYALSRAWVKANTLQ